MFSAMVLTQRALLFTAAAISSTVITSLIAARFSRMSCASSLTCAFFARDSPHTRILDSFLSNLRTSASSW
jgi:hypothetical protein